MALIKAPSAAKPDAVVLPAKKIDPKVIAAAVTPVAAWLVALIVNKLTGFHLINGITATSRDALVGFVGSVILSGLVFAAGFAKKHGAPLIATGEADLKKALGPEEFAVLRSQAENFLQGELPKVIESVLPGQLGTILPGLIAAAIAGLTPAAPVTVNVTPAPAVEAAPAEAAPAAVDEPALDLSAIPAA